MLDDFNYKKYWIGRCFQKNETMNLTVGSLYLLKDKTGNQEFFHASTRFDRSSDYFGAYRSTQFEVLLDITEAINSLPFDYTADGAELRLQLILLASAQRNITLEEAEAFLIDKGIISSDMEEVESATPRPSAIPTAKPTHIPSNGGAHKSKPKIQPTEEKAPAPDEKKPKLVQKGLFG